jgi:hypothetical protein
MDEERAVATGASAARKREETPLVPCGFWMQVPVNEQTDGTRKKIAKGKARIYFGQNAKVKNC